MDELAALVGADPLEYRLRHLGDERLAAVLRAAAERAGWDRRRREAGWGSGLACGVEKGGRVATIAEVRETAGRIEVLRVVTAFECGAIVNPDNLRSQIEGATVMALGGALFEAIHFEKGHILNGRLSQYRVPRFSDLPALEVVLVDRKTLHGGRRRDAAHRARAGSGQRHLRRHGQAAAGAAAPAGWAGSRRGSPVSPGGLTAPTRSRCVQVRQPASRLNRIRCGWSAAAPSSLWRNAS